MAETAGGASGASGRCFPSPSGSWPERKERYLAHLAEADPGAVRISLADKLHNARCTLNDVRAIGAEAWTRFTGGRDGTLWYLRGVLSVARARGLHPLLAGQLDEVVTALGETEKSR